MDISKLATGPKSNEGVWMDILHPTTRQPIEDKDGNRARIRVRSTQSRKFKRQLQGLVMKRVVDKNIEDEATTDESNDMIAGLIVGWEGITDKGEPFEFSEDNAKTLLVKCPWLADQINIHAADMANFLGETLPGSTNGQAKNLSSKPRGRAARASENTPGK